MSQSSPDQASKPRKDCLTMAFHSLEAGMRKELEDLRNKFDKDTKKAISSLTGKKPDRETKDILDSFYEQDYDKLTVTDKGELQRWALTAGRRLDSTAVEYLSKLRDKHQSQHNTQRNTSKDATFVSLDELLLICRERQEIAGQKQWVFTFLGKEFNLNSLWGTVVDSVDKLKSAGDLATSASETAGLVWGIIKVLLQFAVLGEKGAGAALTGMATAVNVIQRAATYEKQIHESTGGQALDERAIRPLEHSLISTYQRILKFFVTANKCFNKNKASLCWYVFWSAGDILEFEQDIFKCEQTLFQDAAIKSLINQGLATNNIHNLLKDINDRYSDTQISANVVLTQQNKISLQLRSLVSKVDSMHSLMSKHCLNVTREQILCWFSEAKIEDYQQDAKNRRTKNTARWVFDKPQYHDWRKTNGSSLLWIKGIAGAGKTTVMSRIVDKYRKSVQKGEDFAKPQMAYFYCKRDGADRRFSKNIFRSFIRQLASEYHPLPDKVLQTYKEKGQPSSLSTILDADEYVDLLKELIPRTTETVLILDALDECIGNDTQSTQSSNEMSKVLKIFNELLNTDLPIKIVVASRYDSQIEDKLSGKHMIEISSDDNGSDISKMVEVRIDEHNKNCQKSPIDKKLKKKILKVFNQKSQGKFQWASLHIESLLGGLEKDELRGPYAVERELGKLPTDLITSYHKVFQQIETLKDEQIETAFRVFKWLLAMQGSCDKEVLIAATCQRLYGEPGHLPDFIEGNEGYILTACQHLVIMEGSDFRFSHLSVQEYCEEYQPTLMDTCHYDVAKVCASVLFRYKTPEEATEPWGYYCQHVGISLPFLHEKKQSLINQLWYFACNQWHTHFWRIPNESQRRDIKSIIDDSFPSAFTTWLNVRVTDLIMNGGPLRGRIGDLYLELLTEVNEKGPFSFLLNFRSHKMMRRLDFAERRNREEFPLFLGVPLGPQLWTGSLRSPGSSKTQLLIPLIIETAVSCGILNKIQQFVKKGMKDEMSDERFDRLDLDEYLLEYGWEPSFRQLHMGHAPLQQLLQSIIDSKTMEGQQDTHGSASPPESITRLLELEHETTGGKEFLALCTTFISWREAATLSTRDQLSRFENVFSATSQWDGHTQECYGELARLMLLCLCLVQDQSSLNQQLGDFLFDKFPHATTIRYQHLSPPLVFDLDSALVDAAESLDKRYLDLLLSHGANIDAVTSKATPLIAAISSQNLENARFLLEMGADINKSHQREIEAGTDYVDTAAVATTVECCTPLIAACRHGHVDLVKELLLKGADFSRTVTSGAYTNALCAAMEGQSMRAVRLLLRCDVWQLREDAIESWRKKHYGAMNNPIHDPDYRDTISQKSQDLASWLTLAFLHRVDRQPQVRDEDSAGNGSEQDISSLDGSEDDSVDTGDYDDDDDDDGDEQDTTNEDESEGDTVTTGDYDSDDGGGGGGGSEQEHHQDEDEDYHGTNSDFGGDTDGYAASMGTEQGEPFDEGQSISPGDDIMERNVTNLIKWLYQGCMEDSQGVQRELAKTFGFALSGHQNDDVVDKLVQNALLKGFQEVLRSTRRNDSLDDITQTWAGFLDSAEDCLGLPELFKRTLDDDELKEFHREIDRLEAGGFQSGLNRANTINIPDLPMDGDSGSEGMEDL
ncbi:ankyrin repeat-containing protein [Fusarium austroafricanum]|uniref:Ankyrin repeat-containing protein n=1 Tax=Fusarium austroafricanum TaxID=2364996 RepID=A0A8H4P6L9_9HYPO|nr:ankyrin repeat-containing protein [Fusarium austroafricanum]